MELSALHEGLPRYASSRSTTASASCSSTSTKSGLAENTIVIYTSDQGFYLGEHGWFDKRFMYEESLRTPLVVRWPGMVTPGAVDEQIVSNVDFAPTFLEAAGVEVPADMQGRSLVPLLKGEAPSDWRKSFYYHFYEDNDAIITSPSTTASPTARPS